MKLISFWSPLFKESDKALCLINIQMTITIAMMKDHIQRLLHEHNIQAGDAKQCHEMSGRNLLEHLGGSLVSSRWIFILGIETEEQYFTALHEIGHIVTNDEHHFERQYEELRQKILKAEQLRALPNTLEGLLSLDRFQIRVEFAASLWAKENALEWTDRMRECALFGIKSHYHNRPSVLVTKELLDHFDPKRSK